MSPDVLTRIVDPEVPSRREPESIAAEAPSIVRAPPEAEIVPAVVTLLPASMSTFRPAETTPDPVETVEAALEIITSWPAVIVAVVLTNVPDPELARDTSPLVDLMLAFWVIVAVEL